MATSDSPPIGLSHPTANPSPSGTSAHRRSERCECHDCEYTVAVDDELPATCPKCGGALTLVLP